MFFDILEKALIFFTIFSIASAAGLIAERSGTINLAINGGMVFGALFYFITAKTILKVPNMEMPFTTDLSIPIVIASSLVAMIASLLITSLLSLGAINLKGDQIVIGTAINILAPIISLIVVIAIFNKGGQIQSAQSAYGVSQTITPDMFPGSPWISSLLLSLFGIILMVSLWFIITKTRFGLRVRAAGSNPDALAASGVSVYKIRHMAMAISGALAGLAGAMMAAFAPSMSTYSNNVSGFGYIAIALLIIGQWRTYWIVLGALIFSFLFAAMDYWGIALGEKKALLQTIPYIGAIAIMPFVSRFGTMPAAAGTPYEKTGR